MPKAKSKKMVNMRFFFAGFFTFRPVPAHREAINSALLALISRES